MRRRLCPSLALVRSCATQLDVRRASETPSGNTDSDTARTRLLKRLQTSTRTPIQHPSSSPLSSVAQQSVNASGVQSAGPHAASRGGTPSTPAVAVILHPTLISAELSDALRALGLQVNVPTCESAPITTLTAIEQLQDALLVVYLNTKTTRRYHSAKGNGVELALDPSLPSKVVLQRVCSAFYEHPILKSFFAGAPSWDALSEWIASSPPMSSPSSVDASPSSSRSHQPPHKLMMACSSTTLLSICTLLGRLEEATRCCAGSQNETHQASDNDAYVAKYSEYVPGWWWDGASRMICTWLIHEHMLVPSPQLGSSPLPPHRTHHLVRSASRLLTFLTSSSAGMNRPPQFSRDERMFAVSVVALLYSSLTDADTMLSIPERAQLLAKVAGELYRDVFMLPALRSPAAANRPNVRHMTSHVAYNELLSTAARFHEEEQHDEGHHPRMALQQVLVWVSRWCLIEKSVLGHLEPLVKHEKTTLPSLSTSVDITTAVQGSVPPHAAQRNHATTSAAGLPVQKNTQSDWAAKLQRRLLTAALTMELDISTLATILEKTVTSQVVRDMEHSWTPQPFPMLLTMGTDSILQFGHQNVSTARSGIAAELADLRRSLARAVKIISLRLTLVDGEEREDVSTSATGAAPSEPYEGMHRPHNIAEANVPEACAFVHQLRCSFGSLARRHYASSGGTEVLADAVAVFILTSMVGEQRQPIVSRQRNPKFIATTPSLHTVGEALEMLFFAILLQQGYCRGKDSSSSFDATWVEPSRRILRYVIDALVFNTYRYNREQHRSGGRRDTMTAEDTALSTFFLTSQQLTNPNLIHMPLWQTVEFVAVLQHYCGSLRPECCSTSSESGEEGIDPPRILSSSSNDIFASLSPVERYPNDTTTAHVRHHRENLTQLRSYLGRRVQRLLSLGQQVQQQNRLRTLADATTTSAPSDRRTQLSTDQNRTLPPYQKNLHQLDAFMCLFEFPFIHRGSDTEAVAVNSESRFLKRVKHLSNLSALLGTNYNMKEETRHRRLQRQQQQQQDEGQRRNENTHPHNSSSASEHDETSTLLGKEGRSICNDVVAPSSGHTLMVKVLRSSVAEPLGLGINEQCIVTHVKRSTAFARAMSQLGWYPEDCTGRGNVLRVVSVDDVTVRNVADFRKALSTPSRASTHTASSSGGGVTTRIVIQHNNSDDPTRVDRRHSGGGNVQEERTTPHQFDATNYPKVTHRRAVSPQLQLSAMGAAIATPN
ncbi:GPI-anchored surface protein, putative [Bodo saltans]|uniref:GPI-anchored surface protein, putative n=1 Tax=Bodo saltans TaxID=75058 RepID=A0A0S4KHB6_BODSA|nr:GPI-anchored surface protein, putative [Bodo saltans]|eukprot:CUI11840.1 GPI-anchored surface protein, putative [Bodo saltans]